MHGDNTRKGIRLNIFAIFRPFSLFSDIIQTIYVNDENITNNEMLPDVSLIIEPSTYSNELSFIKIPMFRYKKGETIKASPCYINSALKTPMLRNHIREHQELYLIFHELYDSGKNTSETL